MSEQLHPLHGWEATHGNRGSLVIMAVPNSTLIGLFIRKDVVMFPLAYFRNWHAAHRFAAWMEGADEPEPTLAQEYKATMEQKIAQVKAAPSVDLNMDFAKQSGVATVTTSDVPIKRKKKKEPRP